MLLSPLPREPAARGALPPGAPARTAGAHSGRSRWGAPPKLLGGSGTISVDGEVGKQTWGAIFDLYQYNMAQELGEDFDGVQKLRDLVTFLPDVDPFIGFGESAPVDGVTADNVESQVNRRVEVLFFEKGQESDLALLAEDPKASELYLPEVFVREEMGNKTGSAKKQLLFLQFLDDDGVNLGAFSFHIEANDGRLFSGHTDNATIRQLLDSQTTSAEITIDGTTIHVAFEKVGS